MGNILKDSSNQFVWLFLAEIELSSQQKMDYDNEPFFYTLFQ